jgi:uncharacterized protein
MNDKLGTAVGFQWDYGNAHKNLIAHNVDNWECEQIFLNEPLLVLDDRKHSEVEKRWAAFGKTAAGRLLTVIFTRRGELIRVISARDMSRKERKFYEEKRDQDTAIQE